MRDWRSLMGHWERHPPACELLEVVAMQVGWSPGPAKVKALDADGLRALESELANVDGGGR